MNAVRLALVALALALTGCGSGNSCNDHAACFRCEDGRVCPSGYTCGAGSVCTRDLADAATHD